MGRARRGIVGGEATFTRHELESMARELSTLG